MASKYDMYWSSIMKEIYDGIMESMSEDRTVNIDVQNITAYGNRNSWYGTVEVSSEGIKGGEMAHALSLGKMIVRQDFMTDMKDAKIKLIISKTLKLEIEVNGKKSLKGQMQKKIKQPIIPYKHPSVDIITTPPNLLLERIYSLLDNLPMFDYLYEPNNLPKNGIYFFYEDGELCEINGKITERIVRVGTDKADDRFRDRIRNHYKGNKNSSVFRKHVGSAIINKNKPRNIDISEWMKPMTPTSNDIEELINLTFKEKFRFRCIYVQSENDRLYLEKRLIATLSHWNYSPSSHWLGHFAERKEIQNSGLWNVQHINNQNIMKEEDLTFLKEKIDSKRTLNQYSVVVDKGKKRGIMQNKVICFIPCCGLKYPSGNIIKPERILSSQDLPNTWGDLVKGRKLMQDCIRDDTSKTTAINLYTGSPYDVLSPYKKKIIELIHSGQFRLLIISAGYGIIDALEPIHNYDKMMKGKVASHWRNTNLTNVIADLLLHERPTRIYGFFAGEPHWSTSGSKYRYFFTEGVKTLREELDVEFSGCFYRVEGRGVKAILGSIGRTFNELLKSNFSDSYVNNIHEKGRRDGNVKIGFDKITT